MPAACWRKGRSPWAKSFDHRGRPCTLVGTVEKVEAAVVLGLLALVLLVIALGWVVRYSRKAARFRAFWNQPPGGLGATHHRLGSTTADETFELEPNAPLSLPYVDRGSYGRRPPSTVRSSASAESLSLASTVGEKGGGKGPKYAVPRSTSRPQSTFGLDQPGGGGVGGGLGSRKSSYGSLNSATGGSPLGQSTGNGNSNSGGPRPALAPSRMSSSVLSQHHGRSPLSTVNANVDEQGAFLAYESGERSPRTPEATYGSGGLDSPPAGDYHPSSPNYAYPSTAPRLPFDPTLPALSSPLDRFAYAPSSPPPPHPSMRASGSAFASPPASPGVGRGPNFSRPTSRAGGVSGASGRRG